MKVTKTSYPMWPYNICYHLFLLAGLSSSGDFYTEIECTLSGYLIFSWFSPGIPTYMPLFALKSTSELSGFNRTTKMSLPEGLFYIQYIHHHTYAFINVKLRAEGPCKHPQQCHFPAWTSADLAGTWWELIVKPINRSHHNKDQNIWLPSACLNERPRSTK